MKLLPFLFLLLACGNRPPPPPEQVENKDTQEHQQADLDADEATSTLPEASILTDTDDVTVYYRHPRLPALVPRRKQIFRHFDEAGRIKQVIDQLSIAPPDGYGDPIWPENTHVREIYLLDSGTLVVDFHGEFLERLQLGATGENLMVFSLVNSVLDSFPSYQKVFILVHGEILETFLGHIDIERPLILNRRDIVVPDEPVETRLIEEDLPLKKKVAKQLEGLN